MGGCLCLTGVLPSMSSCEPRRAVSVAISDANFSSIDWRTLHAIDIFPGLGAGVGGVDADADEDEDDEPDEAADELDEELGASAMTARRPVWWKTMRKSDVQSPLK